MNVLGAFSSGAFYETWLTRPQRSVPSITEEYQLAFCFISVFVVLGMEPRALCMLGKHTTTTMPQPFKNLINLRHGLTK